MRLIFQITAAFLFLASFIAYFIVRRCLRPGFEEELDDYYYELEEQHPGYARYLKWSRITFTIAVIASVLLLLTIRF